MINKKVAILTNFMEFNPGYSLTGIVQDQCKMLQDNGHQVKLFVNSQYNMASSNESLFSHNVSSENPKIELYRTIPFSHLVDYTSIKDLSDYHKDIVRETKKNLLRDLEGVSHVFTHDFIFTGWFLPYGLGVIEAAKELPNVTFLHWIHSTPSSNRDWWDFNSWGGNHKLIFPNNTEKVMVAEQYKTLPHNVSCIHHIKDLRTWYDFGKDSNDFISDHPEILSTDVVKVYPVSTDRLGAKGLSFVMEIFSNFKKYGYSTCLVIANQWATGLQRKEDVNNYIKFGESLGLINNKDFIFTSEWEGREYDTGIPKRMLRELCTCANMFIFPTREESFGLIGVEIPLSTAAITVTNKSLALMSELHGTYTKSFNFGSFNQNVSMPDVSAYLRDISLLIHNAFKMNDVVLHRTFLRQRYNWDYLYFNEYLPLLMLDVPTT